MSNIVPNLTISEQGVVPAQDVWPPVPVLPPPSGFLWTQQGPGQPIVTTDPNATVQSGVNQTVTPLAEVSVCLGGSSNTCSNGGTVCLGGFLNTASGSSAGVYSSFLCTSSGTTSVCAASNGSTASGLGSACIGSAGGTASGTWCAIVGGTNGVASGQNSAVVGGNGGVAAGLNSVSIGGGNAPNDNDIAVGGAAALVGFFGAACVAQQAGGGTGIAGPAYTGNEQAMLQAVYTALKNLGLIA
jgi:hypothetical protein